MYPRDFQTRVEVTGITRGLCGAFRPDYFPGVTTVVLKLFNIVMPDLAVFGEKDYSQQMETIKRMEPWDLDLETLTWSGWPTFREPDGLAMSSRNTYLSPDQRGAAASLYQALNLAGRMVREGERNAAVILDAVRNHIEKFPQTDIQYASLVDLENLSEIDEVSGPALLALAVFVGKTRLIDNMVI